MTTTAARRRDRLTPEPRHFVATEGIDYLDDITGNKRRAQQTANLARLGRASLGEDFTVRPQPPRRYVRRVAERRRVGQCGDAPVEIGSVAGEGKCVSCPTAACRGGYN